jgi:peptidoglycan-associated lipoprotein
MRAILFVSTLALLGSSASAQLPGLRRYTPADRRQQAAQQVSGIDALRGDFMAKTGGDTVFFGIGAATLAAPAKATLSAQAAWLRQHPDVVVRVEGHGDTGDTRDHALAVGARRAEEVRQYLVLMGVPPAQLSATSFGKERPGAPRATTVLVR